MTDDVIERLKALAHPVRFRILEVLRDGERNVGEIDDAAGIGQPTLSQQLGVLRKAGLVETRREAKLVYYRLGEPDLAELAGRIAALAPEQSSSARPVNSASSGAANFARLS